MQTLNATATRNTAATRRTLGSLLKAVLDRIVAADQAYRARRKMRRLDDRILRDVGLTRTDVDHGGR